MWKFFRLWTTGSQRLYLEDVTGKTASLTPDLLHGQDIVVSEGRRCIQGHRPCGQQCSSHTSIFREGAWIPRSLPLVPLLRPHKSWEDGNLEGPLLAVTQHPILIHSSWLQGPQNHKTLQSGAPWTVRRSQHQCWSTWPSTYTPSPRETRTG